MPGLLTMAPGNTAQLSSNWKKLQETLAKEKKAAPPKDKETLKKENGIPQSLKRKRANEPERKPAVKRNRLETPGQRRNKIRMEQSSGPTTLRKSKSTPHLKSANPSESEEEDDDNKEEEERPMSSNGIQVNSTDGSSPPMSTIKA